uniref:Uncharacterized protein n=1 Tax=Steinernema glaseri TaxID=37863 RepID=A0A1I8AVS1_9BILA
MSRVRSGSFGNRRRATSNGLPPFYRIRGDSDLHRPIWLHVQLHHLLLDNASLRLFTHRDSVAGCGHSQFFSVVLISVDDLEQLYIPKSTTFRSLNRVKLFVKVPFIQCTVLDLR